MTEIQEYLIKIMQELEKQNKAVWQEQEAKIQNLQNAVAEIQKDLEDWNRHLQNLTALADSLSSSYASLSDLCQNLRK